MNTSLRTLAPAVFLLAACFPDLVSAQDPASQPQQEVRYITVTKFELPQDTTDRRLLMMAIDSFMVPMARMNPNVLSYRVLMHNWGANSNDILIMAEYPNWAAIEAQCPACDEWAEAQLPAEGTPERAQWDAIGAAFQRAYAGHSDEIYAAQMRRAKQ
jgi:hypothetical protein